MKHSSTRPATSKTRGSRRGALLLISGIFVASAVIRLLSGTGAAIAKEIADRPNDPPASETIPYHNDEETALLLKTLLEREAAVTDKEFALAQKEKVLEVAKTKVLEQMAALERAEQHLKATMVQVDEASENDLSKLTDVYEAMKPKDAAALFETMAPDFAAGFLSRMHSEAAGAVMAGLKPETAYTISVILAGRNANAGGDK